VFEILLASNIRISLITAALSTKSTYMELDGSCYNKSLYESRKPKIL